jgi:hypothetical protein
LTVIGDLATLAMSPRLSTKGRLLGYLNASGQPGPPPSRGRRASLSALHFAIKDKDADGALAVADRLRHVPLRYEARLTLLLAERRHARYEAQAEQFFLALHMILKPKMMALKKLADVLAHVDHHYYGWPAQLALGDVAAQLHRIHRRIEIEIDFDSLPE